MADLFSSDKPDISKLTLSEFKKPPKKVEVEKKKKEVRINKVSAEEIPMMYDTELRKKLFGDKPPSLKELRSRTFYREKSKWGGLIEWSKSW